MKKINNIPKLMEELNKRDSRLQSAPADHSLYEQKKQEIKDILNQYRQHTPGTEYKYAKKVFTDTLGISPIIFEGQRIMYQVLGITPRSSPESIEKEIKEHISRHQDHTNDDLWTALNHLQQHYKKTHNYTGQIEISKIKKLLEKDYTRHSPSDLSRSYYNLPSIF